MVSDEIKRKLTELKNYIKDENKEEAFLLIGYIEGSIDTIGMYGSGTTLPSGLISRLQREEKIGAIADKRPGTKQAYLINIIKERVEKSIYLPGRQIPSEDKFSKEFNVSRTTVRESIMSLVNAGILIKRHGYGTFVHPAYAPHNADTILDKLPIE